MVAKKGPAIGQEAVRTLHEILKFFLANRRGRDKIELAPIVLARVTESSPDATLLMRIAIRKLFSGSKPSAEPSSYGPVRPHCVADILDAADKPYVVVESIRLDMKRRRFSTAPFPADGAEGAAVR